MDSRSAFFALIAATALVCVSSRAVNISNTWMLPEEGFPVFYRYFRDRISWYEADAVCQFHHANLVTVDSTSEYDSVRAYLKELDIVNNVWIGLSKNSEKAQFSWRDFRPLTNEGHWQEAIPVGNTPLCAATDPAADFRWHALSCGGSEVASFICELTVPSWSTGSKGCLLTELPSLTVLYLPEQSAIELTSDCGLDGTKRIACKGNADRDEMMRQLSCSITNDDFDDKTTRGSISESTIAEITNPSQSPNTKSTKPWIWTSNTISTGDYGTPTRHRRETENTFGPDSSTQTTADLKMKQKTSSRLEVTTIPSKIVSVTSKEMLEMATVNNVNDVTLDLSVTQKSNNPSEIIATVTQDSTTSKYNNKPEEQEESFSMAISTPNSNAQEGNLDEVGEYPGVINQGQLFSIIENGTMFDIIELNETGTEETRDSGFTLSQDNYKISSEIQSSTEQSLNSRALYTTIIYHKEPPEDLNANSDKVKTQIGHDPTPTIKIFESKAKQNEKSSTKHKTLNDLLTKEDDKTLTKEIEMFPIVADSSIKLNRTYRKKLPMSESNLTKEEGEESYGNVDDFIIGDETYNHKVVEIKLHTDNNKSNIKTKLFVTTKLSDKNKQVNKNGKVITNNVKNRNVIENKKDNIEKFDDAPPISTIRTEGEQKETEIDPRIEELNTKMINMTRNIDSEIISPIPFQETNLKTQFLPKSLLEQSDEISKSPELIINDMQDVSSTLDNPTTDTLDSVPQQQPRPNRQRLLTKPQRRSFYPYFFSRVLG